MKSGANLTLKLLVKKDPKIKYLKILSQKGSRERSTISLKEQRVNLIIEIKAKDATALRASVNSILRDLQAIEATNTNTKGV
ncbi:MAG: KEOPS complex subunit Pcc1 [Candidatus Micrarchaeaceae archaeon]|jgi:tRNA threonylcarbamoyladenosine modification (KEOPS) complex  Pcc1 subunit